MRCAACNRQQTTDNRQHATGNRQGATCNRAFASSRCTFCGFGSVSLVTCYVAHRAARCITVQHAATQYSTLQHSTARCNTVQHAATQYSTLQHSTTRCNTVQHAATQYNTLQTIAARSDGLSNRRAARVTWSLTRIANDTTAFAKFAVRRPMPIPSCSGAPLHC